MQRAAEMYMDLHAGRIVIDGGCGTARGYQALLDGTTDIAMASGVVERGGSLPACIAARRGAIDLAAMTRPLSDSEDDAGARQYLVARDRIGVIVHRTLPVAGLTQAQVRGLFAGATRSRTRSSGFSTGACTHCARRCGGDC